MKLQIVIDACCITSILAFVPAPPTRTMTYHVITSLSRALSPLDVRLMQRKSTIPLNNFFKDLMESAFENDPNLSSNKAEGQLEGPNEDFEVVSNNLKSDVQVQRNNQSEIWRKQFANDACTNEFISNTTPSVLPRRSISNIFRFLCGVHTKPKPYVAS